MVVFFFLIIKQDRFCLALSNLNINSFVLYGKREGT